MKSIITTKYGAPDVLELRDIAKPIPKDNEVLIKVHAASVTTADTMMRTGTPYIGRLFLGLWKPKISTPGTGFAGVIESVGKEVTQFEIGGQVFGESIFGLGTNAEYVCVSEKGVLQSLPINMSYEEAAPVCDGALTSLSFLKDIGNIKSGQRILINGASGSLGTAAIQIAKYMGAHVTAVCSTENKKLVTDLGADIVIAYTEEDFTKVEQRFDIVYDTVGKSSYASCKNILTERGVYLCPVLDVSLLLQMMWTSSLSKKKAKFSATGIRPLSELRQLLGELKVSIESGKIRSVLDRVYSLNQTAEAHKFVDQGHKRGNVVVTVDWANGP